MAQLYGRWRNDPEYWLEAEYRVRRQAFGSWGKGGGYFMGAPHQALLMVSGTATDPNFSSTVLLFNPSATAGSTTMSDQSALARGAFTFAGNAAHSTTQNKFSSSSIATDGTGDNLNITATVSNDPTCASICQVEQWVWLTTAGSLRCLSGTRAVAPFADLAGYFYYKAANNVTNLSVFRTGGGLSLIAGNATVSASAWHHVGFIIDSTTGTNHGALLLDGNRDAATTTTYTPAVTGVTAQYVGSSGGEDGTRDWLGYLGPTRMYLGVRPTMSPDSTTYTVPVAAFPTS